MGRPTHRTGAKDRLMNSSLSRGQWTQRQGLFVVEVDSERCRSCREWDERLAVALTSEAVTRLGYIMVDCSPTRASDTFND